MYICSNVVSTQLGQVDAFKRFVAEMVGAMAEADMPVSVKASVIGTDQPEVYINTIAPDMATLMGNLQKLRASKAYKRTYDNAGRIGSAIGIDSFTGQLLEGFDASAGLSEGALAGGYWRHYPGRQHDLREGFHAARAIHEKHGATRVRGYQIFGGRFSGCHLYMASYPSLTDLGKGFDAADSEMQAMLTHAAKDPSAELVSNIILDNPILVSASV